MRKSIATGLVAFLAVLAFSSIALGQGRGRVVPPGFIAEGVPKMPNPPGPAPKRDLSGAWVGPMNTNKPDPVPPMTPAGAAIFQNHHAYLPSGRVVDAGKLPPTNRPFD